MTTLPLATSSSTKPLFNDNSTTTPSSSRSKYILIAISCLTFIILLCVIIPLSNSPKHRKELSPSRTTPSPPSPTPNVPLPTTDILSACQATRNPHNCVSSLRQSNLVPENPTPLEVIQSALLLSSQNLETVQTMLNSILSASSDNTNLTTVANICLEVLDYSQYRLFSSNDLLSGGEINNARAWMSAALTYEYDCLGGLKHYINDTQSINKTTSGLEDLINCTSNALSMIRSYHLFGNETESWRPPQTERDGFWEDQMLGNNSEFNGGIPQNLEVDVTVCKDGANGCYKTVQEAVNAAPVNVSGGRFVVHIKEGVYEEIVRVPFNRKNVVFIGDGVNKTVITGSRKSGERGVTTYDSATVGVLGDGFMASGLTIQNTAGAPTQQAVAFRSDSDQSVIENCEFLGNQDTLYAHSLRQYYKSCKIQGNVDFIFGNAAAIFEDCTILVTPRQENPEQGDNNVVTAHGRTEPSQSTGFVFRNCSISGTDKYMEFYNANPNVHKNYLGRPWKEYSRTVYLSCSLEKLVTPEGWMIWSGDFALKTLYYGEFENSGPGSNTSQRVEWSSLVPSQYVSAYSIENFIQGGQWIPSSS